MRLYNYLNEEELGQCYVLAYQFMDKHYGDKQLRLVHGLVSGQGPLTGKVINHAWVERGPLVYDMTTQQQVFPKDQYYKIGKIKKSNVFKYTHDEVMKNALEFETYGPWEKKLLKNKY